MTIALAWVRRIHDCEELVFASDSRLSGDGRDFDACPKIMTLSRGDCAIAFAGYTGDAFPLMLQLLLAIESHEPSRRRSLDITAIRKHALKVFDAMFKQVQSNTTPKTSTLPEVEFLFGGYSWVRKSFQIWSIEYRVGDGRFSAHPRKLLLYSQDAKTFLLRTKRMESNAASMVAFAGDQASVAEKLLVERMNSQYPGGSNYPGLDMEPFEVVRDMLRAEDKASTIGGAPQIVKVYQYMQAAPLGVYWPNRAGGRIFLLGRPCLDYERLERFILDPDSLISSNPWLA